MFAADELVIERRTPALFPVLGRLLKLVMLQSVVAVYPWSSIFIGKLFVAPAHELVVNHIE